MGVVVKEPLAKYDDSYTRGSELQSPPDVAVTPADRWPRPYYFEDGLRKVEPYHFTYQTNVKERWRGRQLLEIFCDEFRDRPVEYYVKPT